MNTTTLDRPPETANRVVQVVHWKGKDPVQDSLSEWGGGAIAASNWEVHEDSRAMVVLNALQYPVWKRIWDNPEDSVYDQFLFEL